MAFEETLPQMNCVECGKMVDEQTVWLDNSGPLCRLCAIRKRVERMRGVRHSVNEHWNGIDKNAAFGRLRWRPYREAMQKLSELY